MAKLGVIYSDPIVGLGKQKICSARMDRRSGLYVSSPSIGLVFFNFLKRSVVATNSSTVGKSNE